MKHWPKSKNAGRKKNPFGLIGVVREAMVVTAFLKGFLDGLGDVHERSGFRPEEVTDLRPDEYEVVENKPKMLSPSKTEKHGR